MMVWVYVLVLLLGGGLMLFWCFLILEIDIIRKRELYCWRNLKEMLWLKSYKNMGYGGYSGLIMIVVFFVNGYWFVVCGIFVFGSFLCLCIYVGKV